MLLKNNPTLTDFYRVQQNRIYKQLSFVGSGEKRSYIGLGEYISLNGAIRWMPSKRMSIDAGGMFSRQFYFASPLFRQDIMGVNTRIQYALTNNIRLNSGGSIFFRVKNFHSLLTILCFHIQVLGLPYLLIWRKMQKWVSEQNISMTINRRNGNWSLPDVSLLVFNDNKTAMKENYIYQILKQFFVNSYPPEIEEKCKNGLSMTNGLLKRIKLCLSFGTKWKSLQMITHTRRWIE